MKSPERILAEKIQALTGMTLISINSQAWQYVNMGLCKTRLEALEYMFGLEDA